MNPIRKIVVGADFSEATQPVVLAAIALARSFKASVDVVHVREPFAYPVTGGTIPSAQQKEVLFNWIDKALSDLGERFAEADIPCITTSLDGAPHIKLISHAEMTGADLIVVGTHGRGGLAHAVLGSVAERVVQKAHRPVLVVPLPRREERRACRGFDRPSVASPV
jgi:nucleotide-binding universal stress UspA family protein